MGKIRWHIGCSGFHYKHWKGVFYPEDLPQKKWFDYYCRFFDTLELNVTFYRFPQLSFLKNWYEKSPAKFRFAVKAPKAITHYKKFLGTEQLMTDFYTVIRDGLQEKLGCILFQLPPRLSYSEEFLRRVTDSLDPSFANVIEFRHESWWKEEVYHELARHHIAFCGMSHPALPKEVICNTSLFYYRFHGDRQLYASEYSKKELQETIEIVETHKNVKKAYVFFNNDIFGHAVTNAQQMAELAKK
jgi:uncharacterized protein YecE (DUF72 family)